MNRMLIVVGFIVLIAGGVIYTFLPYTTTARYEIEMDGDRSQTTTSTTTGHSPLGAAVMFIGFTIVVVGLFYKPEEEKTRETMSSESATIA